MSIPRLMPGIAYGAPPRVARVSGALGLPPRLIVIHDTSNTASAAGEANYAATRTDAQSGWTSCHFYVDAAGPLGSTPLDTVAWAAYSYANHNGWHIEMCGYNTGHANEVPATTIATTAQLVRRLCDLAGIPKVKLSPEQVPGAARGICGHYDVTLGFREGDHDDPGPQFDWGRFMALVNGGGTAHASTVDSEVEMISGVLPAGFGADETGAVDAAKPFVPVTFEDVGVPRGLLPGRPAAITFATDFLPAAKTVTVRVALGNGTGSGWTVKTVVLSKDKPRGYVQVPAGVNCASLVRQKSSATDTADQHPVAWALAYGAPTS